MSVVAGRVPCPRCGVMILEGARKCRACRSWVALPRGKTAIARSLTLLCATVVAVAAVLISNRKSPVGDAPPLTEMAAGTHSGEASSEQVPDEASETEPEIIDTDDSGPTVWRTRQLDIDTRPLDLTFSADGKSVYVSGDDATLWEMNVVSGKVHHMAKVPAQGDSIRLLHDKYIAIIRQVDAAHIPVVNTDQWDREPILLWVGGAPADIVGLPDGKTAITASRRGKRLSWFDLSSGRRLADIRLPHETSQLLLLELQDERPYLGAMGILDRGGQPAGAWLDLFDPSEKPFGATRRSISVGRDPRPGAVSRDRRRLFFPDQVSNSATLLRVDATTKPQTVAVGQGPIAAFLMQDDHYGVTIDRKSRTATVVSLASLQQKATLMLDGVPSFAAASRDGRTLFVSLGGEAWPPRERGALVIAGDPPAIVATLETGKGAARIATSPDGKRAAIANYWDRAITIVEPE